MKQQVWFVFISKGYFSAGSQIIGDDDMTINVSRLSGPFHFLPTFPLTVLSLFQNCTKFMKIQTNHLIV